MKILLLGATGQLGRSFLDAAWPEEDEVTASSRDGALPGDRHGVAMDLAEPASLDRALDRVRPDVIINAAAYTAVDRAEDEEGLATRINGESVGRIGAWAAAHGALVLHYSTDYVFDGAQEAPYAPDAPTAPVNAYGRSKLAGERALRASGAPHLIIRTGWVYAAHGTNFLRSMLRLGSQREELAVVADQHGAPTGTGVLVAATLRALGCWSAADDDARRALTGTWHAAAGGATTWHGFAQTIFAEAVALGLLAHAPRVVPVTSAAYAARARRPAWSLLDTRAFQRQFAFPLPDWQQGLHAVMLSLAAARPAP